MNKFPEKQHYLTEIDKPQSTLEGYATMIHWAHLVAKCVNSFAARPLNGTGQPENKKASRLPTLSLQVVICYCSKSCLIPPF